MNKKTLHLKVFPDDSKNTHVIVHIFTSVGTPGMHKYFFLFLTIVLYVWHN